MGQPSLEPIRLRMERVGEHAQDLNEAIQGFYETKPYEVVHEFDLNGTEPMPPSVDPSKGVHLYRVIIRHPVPPRVAILAGEVLQGMRSALDYVAWQLSLARSDSPPPMTAFPIFFRQGLYEGSKQKFIGGIDAAIHPIFDSVQPYVAGDKAHQHPLWVLHRLANDDKHRVPHVVGSLPNGVQVPRSAGVDLFAGMTIGPFENQQVVATVGIIGGADPETQLNPRFSFAVAFGKDTPAEGRHLTSEIGRIGVEVDATIKKFEPFFP